MLMIKFFTGMIGAMQRKTLMRPQKEGGRVRLICINGASRAI